MRNRPVLMVLAGFLLLSAPFLHRAWLFDDSSVVVSADGTWDHWPDPYGFTLDLARPGTPNWTPGQKPVYTHPILSSLILGAVRRFAGSAEWPLHLFMFLLAAAGLWAASRLFFLWTDRVVWPLAFLALSPAYFLTALTLYPHLFYFVFYVTALYFFHQSVLKNRWAAVPALAGALFLAAISLHGWPWLVLLLAGAWAFGQQCSVARGKKLGAALALFAAAFSAWSLWEANRYGMSHFWASWLVRGSAPAYPWRAAYLPLVFLAGAVPVTALAWPVLWKTRRTVFAACAALCGASFLIFSSDYGGFSAAQSLLFSFFLGTGLAFLSAAAFEWTSGNQTGRWLAAWFFAEFLFVQVFLTLPSGHHLLTLALPTVLLAARFAESVWGRRFAKPALVAGLGVLTLLLAHADWKTAEAGRAVSRQLPAAARGFLWGNDFSGWFYYGKQRGWKPFDPDRTPQPGDLLVVSKNLNAAGRPPIRVGRDWHVVDRRAYDTWNPFRTLSLADGAGWYSASWGPLPFSWSRGPLEEFVLLQYRPESPS